jgi:hypothetical protein
MIRVIANLFRFDRPASGPDGDPLGEILRGARDSNLAPEILLRIL